MSRLADTVARASKAELDAVFERVKNWRRWGPDDERGTLNLLGEAKTRAALDLVSEGRSLSLSRKLVRDVDESTAVPVQHFMFEAGDALGHSTPGLEEAFDFLGIACHGYSVTHLDALCHVFVNGRMYNDRAPSEVGSLGGRSNAIGPVARTGIVGRAVLLDVPFSRGIEYLEPGEAVRRAELDSVADRLGVTVEPGDVVLVSTGRDARQRAAGPWNPRRHGLAGLHPDCVEWLWEHDVAALGGDGVQDPFPVNAAEGWPFPIHQCGIAGMGLHLIDNLELSALSAACRERGRFDVAFMASPLRAQMATGSPVNPLAIL